MAAARDTTAPTIIELLDDVATASGPGLPATVIGDDQRRISGCAPLDTAGPDHLSFLSNPRYRVAAVASRAGAVVLSPADRDAAFPASTSASASTNTCTLIITPNPYAWYAFAAQRLAPVEPRGDTESARGAHVDPTARVDASALIEPGAVIAAGAQIGAQAWIGANAFIGAAAVIGAATRVYPLAAVHAACRVGARGIIHSAAVIGADGFGFAPYAGRWIKIPQTGRVIIGDDVEIGAGTTIDRGTMGDTIVEDGVKIDNQVQIGHNCRIGAHTVIAGCVGIAGSARIGRGCQIGGAAMIAGHLQIADGCAIGPATLVSRTITQPGHYTGFFPMMRNADWERNAAVLRHLDELRARVRELEAALKTRPIEP